MKKKWRTVRGSQRKKMTATISYLSSLPTFNSSVFLLSQFAAFYIRKSIMCITANALGIPLINGISSNMVLPILNAILPKI